MLESKPPRNNQPETHLDLRVVLPGESTGLNLAANQVLNVNVELSVGSAASVVEVRAAGAAITTETNELAGIMNSYIP